MSLKILLEIFNTKHLIETFNHWHSILTSQSIGPRDSIGTACNVFIPSTNLMSCNPLFALLIPGFHNPLTITYHNGVKGNVWYCRILRIVESCQNLTLPLSSGRGHYDMQNLGAEATCSWSWMLNILWESKRLYGWILDLFKKWVFADILFHPLSNYKSKHVLLTLSFLFKECQRIYKRHPQ